MRVRPARALVICALLAVGLAPAATPIRVYGGVFRPGQVAQVSYDAPAGTLLRLERVADPQALFGPGSDPHQPRLPEGARTSLVRTLRTEGRGYGQLNLGRLSSGVYVLRAGPLATVVLVSRLGLVVKRDQNAALTYTADRESGATRAARVWRGGDGAGTLANMDGVARFGGGATENEFFLARSGDDWAVSGADWNSYAAPLVRGYVYTDRPVYRPGQHVDFKAVLRKAGSLAPLANTAARVTVFSPDDQAVFRKSLTTNAFGSLGAGLDLPEGAKLGDYRFELKPEGADGDGDTDIGGSFTVEAYQKPEYAVTLKAERARAVQGDAVAVRVNAAYLFGGAVGGARVTYNVTRAPYYPPGFDEGELPPDAGGQDYGSDLVVREETRLNARGELIINLPLARDPDGRPASYRIEAEVEDESRRTVSGSTRVIAFPAALNVDASSDGYVYDAGKPIRLSLDTRDLADQARAAPVTVDLIRQRWERVQGEWTTIETRVARTTARTGANGMGAATLSASRGGGYLLRATVKDAQGRASTAESFVWVLKPGEDWGWNYRDMTVKLDRRQYAPGDTATVLVGNPKPGAPVLLTLEGDKLRKSVVLRGTGAALTYRFPVTADMSPNIYVAGTALGDGNLYTSEARVKVPRPGSALSVSVTPASAKYKPGDTGAFSVQVKDAQGRGVPAELALGVVDQAIYLVRPDSSTPMLGVFGAPRDNAVGTQSSLSFYFESAGAVAAAPRAPLSEAAFAQSKDERAQTEAPAETPRQDFRDTILWVPNLLTDAQGRASVQVKFPDNLTTWVATARAQTSAPRFGQATASTLVTKDVIARLSLPPFLVRGDRVTLAGVVNNTLGQKVEGKATAQLSGLSPAGQNPLLGAGAPLSVAAQGRARQDFQVRADAIGAASVTFGARTASGSDALKLPLPVKARGYQVSQTAVGSAEQPEAKLNIPADTTLSTAQLRLDLTPSLLAAVSPALEYLVGYPYGCTEQTMSRFLPALLARQALGPDALPQSVRRDLPKITSLGLARLYTFQHEDGGWNFWTYDDSTVEMSAYVVNGLLRAKALGVAVDNRVLDRGLGYLAQHAATIEAEQGARAVAYRTLADAGRADKVKLNALARKANLEPYALAQLSLALAKTGQPQAAKDLLDRLKSKRIGSQNGALAHWEKPKDRQDRWYFYWDDNSVQVTAAALEALAKLEPQSPLIPRVSQWLLQNRRGPRWISTQDTTGAIIAALALKPSQTQTGNATVRVSLNGQAVGQAQVSGNATATLSLTAAQLAGLKTGSNTLSISSAPRGLSFAAELTSAREPAQLSGDAGKGFVLARKYEKLEPVWNAKDRRYTYRRTPLLRGGAMQPVTVGDLVLVTLNVRPTEDRAASYLLVSDPIPAGMRALDDRSLAIAGLNDGSDQYDWESWNYWYSGRDLLDDRVDLYASYLYGQQRMTYVLRAQTPGSFTALPTHAFLMYDPDVQGYGPAATLTVRDRGQ